MKTDYLSKMRNGDELNIAEMLIMIAQLSMPAIMAQLSVIVMQYIDASMVGHLGASASASIGLMSSSTWIFNGLCASCATGFTVQIARKIGAKDEKGARDVVIAGLLITLIFSMTLSLLGVYLSGKIPDWLGADPSIRSDAIAYFRIYAMFLPFVQLNSTETGMIQCSGNMKVPGIAEVVMCFLDVVFNFFLIFPTRQIPVLGMTFTCPGAGLGVSGAALGTAFSVVVIVLFLLYYLLVVSSSLHLRKGSHFTVNRSMITTWLTIGVPMGIEQFVTCFAYVMFTKIVSPLGTIAIAANSFGITAESLCYMPGYGIGAAATTIIGQCIGGKRYDLSRKMGWLITAVGVLIMTISGFIMYMIAPYMIGVLTPDEEIRALGTLILRIEAFAEPMYAASIVITGVFRGLGKTYFTTILIFISMWLVRIPLAAHLSKTYMLPGAWRAMCFELCVRGALFILILFINSVMEGRKEKANSETC